jgi:DNA-binding response OmpR family regulator
MKIIIAEGEEDIRTILTITLEDAGHQITTAADGEECLKKYGCAVPGENAGSSFDLVILDYRMPKKGGIEVAKEVLARFPSQRILIATAYTKEIFSWVPEELQHLEFLQKPFELDELIAVIEHRAKRKLS